MEKTLAPKTATTPTKGDSSSVDPQQSAASKQAFIGAGLNMSWRLAIVVLVPVVGGAKLDQHFNMSPIWTITGFVIALIGTALVMRQALQAANRLPVPKLSAAQKKAIQKQYEEDDE